MRIHTENGGDLQNRLSRSPTYPQCNRVASKHDTNTGIHIGVDKDCITLAAMGQGGSVTDFVVFEYPSVNEQRHESFQAETDAKN